MAKSVNELDKKWQWARDTRLPYEKPWLVNLAYYLGDQWIYYDKTTKSIRQPKNVPDYKVLLVANQVQPTVRTELAKLTKNRPVCTVVSNSTDTDDKDQARASNAILDHLWREAKLDTKLEEALLWAILTGKGFLFTYWEKDAGDWIVDYEIQQDEEGNPILDENGNPIPVVLPDGSLLPKIQTQMGEVRVDAPSPFEIFVDPMGKDDDGIQWFFRDRVQTVEWVEENYNKKVSPESVDTLAYLDHRILGHKQLSGKNVCIVREYWERPSKARPEGRFIVRTGNGVLLHSGPNPYVEAGIELPLVSITHIPVPGRYYGESVVSQLVPVQTEYNKTRSQIVELKNLMAMPKWLSPQGAMLTTPTGKPGQVLEYSPAMGKPEAWVPPPLPSYVIRELDRAKEEMIEISGIHEVSRGSIPSNVRSGIAIAYIQEQDDTRLNVTAHSYERAIARTGRNCLKLARYYYDEPRVVRYVGKDKVTQVIEFRGRDIPDDADVHVEAGSSLPRSLVAQQQFLLDLWNARVITDQRLMLRLLQFGNVEDLYKDAEVDIDQAQRENMRMMQGIPVLAEDFHVHDIHIYEHNKFRKSATYEEAPPEIKQLFAEHVAQHQRFIMPQQLPPQPQQPNQLEQMMVMQGGDERLNQIMEQIQALQDQQDQIAYARYHLPQGDVDEWQPRTQ